MLQRNYGLETSALPREIKKFNLKNYSEKCGGIFDNDELFLTTILAFQTSLRTFIMEADASINLYFTART
jgi:hypothetical protein